MVKVVVRGRNNYWRFTVHSWALEVREILEYELGEPVEVSYLIEIVKKAVLRLRDTAPGTS
ncbi:MAG: hypothetical protein QXD75_00145 [Desulfurococcaceae archaeon]